MLSRFSCFILCFAVLSCSIKENRVGCPAWLTVVSDGHLGEENEDGKLVFNIVAGSGSGREDGLLETFSAGGTVLTVPRMETVNVDVLGGVSAMEFAGGVLKIPSGCDCDCIVGGSGSICLTTEEGILPLPLNRCYARLLMTLSGNMPDPCPYRFVLTGGVDGYELPGLRPHRGVFRYEMPALSANNFTARVPRQSDNTLQVEIWRIKDEELISTVPVGVELRALEYDWNAPDLNDIFMLLDFARADLTISVEDWDKETIVKVEI